MDDPVVFFVLPVIVVFTKVRIGLSLRAWARGAGLLGEIRLSARDLTAGR